MQVNVLEESASGTHCGVGKELVLWNTLIPNHKWTTRSHIVVQYQSQGDSVEWAMGTLLGVTQRCIFIQV
jgi:hypothetical protein